MARIIIDSIVIDPPQVPPGGMATVTINARSRRGRKITYDFTVDYGTLIQDSVNKNIFYYWAPT